MTAVLAGSPSRGSASPRSPPPPCGDRSPPHRPRASGKPVAVDVSFDAGAAVRLRGGRFAGERVAAVNALLAAHPEVRAERLFDASEASLDRRRARVRGKGRRGVPGPQPPLPPRRPGRRGARRAAGRAAAARRGRRGRRRAPPAAARPPRRASSRASATPPPRRPASTWPPSPGCPAAAARRSKIVDVEYAWNRAHEELGKAAAPGALIAQRHAAAIPSRDENGDHGTAVLGELIGDRQRRSASPGWRPGARSASSTRPDAGAARIAPAGPRRRHDRRPPGTCSRAT